MLTVNCGFAGRVHITKHTGDGVGERITVENTFLPSYLASISGNETASGTSFPNYIRYGQGVHTDLSDVSDLKNPIGSVSTSDNSNGGPSTIIGDVRVAHRYVRAQITPRGVPWTLSEVGLRRGSGSSGGVVSYVEVLKDGEHVQVLENEYVQLEYEYQVHYPVKVVQEVYVAGTPTVAEFFTGGFSSALLVGSATAGTTRLYGTPDKGQPRAQANFGLHGADETRANWPGGVACVDRFDVGNQYHCNFTPHIPKTDLDTLKVTIIWNFQNATYIPLD